MVAGLRAENLGGKRSMMTNELMESRFDTGLLHRARAHLEAGGGFATFDGALFKEHDGHRLFA